MELVVFVADRFEESREDAPTPRMRPAAKTPVCMIEDGGMEEEVELVTGESCPKIEAKSIV